MNNFFSFQSSGPIGQMIVLSAASGTGKTTIAQNILDKNSNAVISLSYTTRLPRPNEENNIHYRFISKDEFENKIENGEFAEYAEVFGNFYGTSRLDIEELLSEGRTILFDIDWQGMQQLKKHYEKCLTSIFLLPPSLSILEERLRNRNTDSVEIQNARMEQARSEISHATEYDFILVNDDVEKITQSILAVIHTKDLELASYDLVDKVIGLKVF